MCKFINIHLNYGVGAESKGVKVYLQNVICQIWAKKRRHVLTILVYLQPTSFLLSAQIRFQCDIERTVNKYKYSKLFLLTSCVLVCESDECRKTSIWAPPLFERHL